MIVVAVYSMKGGVGKTTSAVNLAYLAATEGRRVLLWDLDPQGAASFAFRVQPRVPGFGRKALTSGQTLAAAIRATDYDRLDLLPADFAYRKLDHLLREVGHPSRVMTAVLQALGRDYDVVFVDCPAGLSLANEGVLAAADAVLVPTIPVTLPLRALAHVLRWADRTQASFVLAAFLSMVDRRKAVHRRTFEWLSSHHDLFLTPPVPYAASVEEMSVRRMPLPRFARRDPAAAAFAGIWSELQGRVRQRTAGRGPRVVWAEALQDVEALIAELELLRSESPPDRGAREITVPAGDHVHFVHAFDTPGRDLQQHGALLQLRESAGRLLLVAAIDGRHESADTDAGPVEVVIDRGCAVQVLSGQRSPLAAIEARLGDPLPLCVQRVRRLVGSGPLEIVESIEVTGTSA
jgi:cellulose biosynthesis protein BcsQ